MVTFLSFAGGSVVVVATTAFVVTTCFGIGCVACVACEMILAWSTRKAREHQ